MCRRSVCVDGSSSLDALREGASAGNVGDAMEMLDVAPLEGGVGWHRSMIDGAAGGVLGGVVGEEGLGLIGVGSPLEGVSGWHKSMIVGAAWEAGVSVMATGEGLCSAMGRGPGGVDVGACGRLDFSYQGGVERL